MIIISILGYILAIILLILLAVLFIPIEYGASGYKDEEDYNLKVHVSWFFRGLAFSCILENTIWPKLNFKLFGFEVKQKRDGKSENKSEKKKKKQKEKSGKDAGKFFNKEFISKAIGAVVDVLVYLKPRVFDIQAVFGFDDPSYTGLACIVVYNIPRMGENCNIDLTPVFDEEVLKGRFNIQGRIVLATILWIALKFILSKPVRNIIFKRERKIKNYAN